MKWFLKRLSEPSSCAAISGISGGVTLATSGSLEAGIISIVTGILGFVIGERKGNE